MDLRWRLALCTASRFPFFAHLYLSRLHDKYHGRQTIMANRQEVPADRDAVANPTTDAILTFSAIEAALRHGGRGTVGDMRAIVSNWHFNPDDLAPLATRGAFYVFHGTCDTTVPPEWTQEGYAKVPGAIVRFWEGDGHASTIARASDEVGAILRRMFLDSDCGGRGCPVHGRGANDDRLDSGVIE